MTTLVFAGSETEKTILSVIHSELFRFFTTIDILPCRLVCREFKEIIANYPWNDINNVVKGNICRWRMCFPIAKAINLNARIRKIQVTNEDIIILRRIKYINITSQKSITNAAFQYLTEAKCIIMNGCDQITDEAFVNLPNLRRLEISYCYNISDSIFKNLRNLKYLNIIDCQQITDVAFQYIPNIIELNIGLCRTLSDDIFQYLKNIEALNLTDCYYLTPEIFKYLKHIKYLIINKCSDDLIEEAKELGLNFYDKWSELHCIEIYNKSKSETLIKKKIY